MESSPVIGGNDKSVTVSFFADDPAVSREAAVWLVRLECLRLAAETLDAVLDGNTVEDDTVEMVRRGRWFESMVLGIRQPDPLDDDDDDESATDDDVFARGDAD